MKENYTFSREKLKDILKRKGLTQEKVSMALGRSRSYTSHETIEKTFLNGLERYYGISGKDIGAVLNGSSKGQESGTESGTEGLKEFDYNKLYRCIHEAVYQAVKKALNE